jgi:hypothetical protein
VDAEEDQETTLHEVDDDHGGEVVSYEEMAQGRQYLCLPHEIPYYDDEDDDGDEEEEEEEEQVVEEEEKSDV